MDKAGICGPDGWNGMVKDTKQLTDIIKEKHPGRPVFLFGHSMGSLLAQQYIQDRSKTLTEISFMLGFSEVSSFSRAFKGWTGIPPSEARQDVA